MKITPETKIWIGEDPTDWIEQNKRAQFLNVHEIDIAHVDTLVGTQLDAPGNAGRAKEQAAHARAIADFDKRVAQETVEWRSKAAAETKRADEMLGNLPELLRRLRSSGQIAEKREGDTRNKLIDVMERVPLTEVTTAHGMLEIIRTAYQTGRSDGENWLASNAAAAQKELAEPDTANARHPIRQMRDEDDDN